MYVVMNDFEKEIEKCIGKANLKKVQSVTVGIAGCGGLGSNCAAHLVRCGVKNLVIADHDTVELSNISRQFYFLDQVGRMKVEALAENLRRINPDISVKTHCLKLDGDNIARLLRHCPIVVEAFDRAECKKLLVEKLLTRKDLIVSASGLAGYGKSDAISTRYPKKNLALIGDLRSGVSAALPPFAPRVAVAAAKQADVILEYILTTSAATD